MRIFIPTYGRSGQQTTFEVFDDHLQSKYKPTLIVQARESHLYSQYPHIALPAGIENISPTRQWILDMFNGNVLMLDDDLLFYVRRTDDRTKFLKPKPHEIHLMFTYLEDMLNSFVHIGMMGREGGNRYTEPTKEVGRIIRVLGYQTQVLKHHNLKFTDIPLMQDHHMNLSLLKLGYPNCILSEFVNNQKGGSDAPGGCSHFRTPELLAQAAYRLEELHRPFVKAVVKTTKGAWGGGTRIDTRIQWKRAYEHGRTTTGILDKSSVEHPG